MEIPANSSNFFSLYCPEGYAVAGGGYSLVSGGNNRVVYSKPATQAGFGYPNVWDFMFENNDNTPINVNGYSVCYPQTT
jgi:hypothetical protein